MTMPRLHILRRPWAALALGILLAFWGLLVLVVMPRIATLRALYRDADALASERAAFAGWEDEMARLGRERASLEAVMKQDRVDLPRLDEEAAVIRTIERAADSAGVRLTRWKPRAPRRLEAHTERSFGIDAVGPFHAVGVLISRLERTPGRLRVPAGSIQTAPAGAVEVRLELVAVFADASQATP
jgi:Tfp pilus assembly protein PilO